MLRLTSSPVIDTLCLARFAAYYHEDHKKNDKKHLTLSHKFFLTSHSTSVPSSQRDFAMHNYDVTGQILWTQLQRFHFFIPAWNFSTLPLPAANSL